MIVVADTSPINYLVLIETIGILPELYGRVLLPRAVLNELRAAGAPAAVRAWAFDLPSWIQLHDPTESVEVEVQKLGAGETQAIRLAVDIDADLILIDDGPARRAAMAVGLNVSGTLGVLRSGAKRGLIDFRTAVSAMRRHGFRMTDQLFSEILEEIGDGRSQSG